MKNTSKSLVTLIALATAIVCHAQQTAADEDAGPLDQVVPVADEQTESAQSIPVDDGLSDEQRLLREFERYRRLINAGTMDEADTSAKRVVEMAIRLYGPQSIETSKALNNLALVQHKNGQHDAAIQNFESAVDIIETVEDRLNSQLVNPLKGLGAAQLRSGRPDLALKSFNRATHITHVNEGPHNIQQVEILESLAESTLRIGDTKGARDVLDRIYALNVRHFANNELELIPALMRRADWQHRARYYNDERATYRRAIRIVEAKLGKHDPQLILPLRKLGESFYFVDLTRTNSQQQGLISTGEMYFKRAVRIAEQAPDIHWTELLDTKLALADYYVFIDAHNRARKIYSNAWELLSIDEERIAARGRMLEQPVVLFEDALPEYVGPGGNQNTSDEEYLTGTIRVDYTVSRRGRVRDIRTEAIPPQFTEMQRMVHREVRARVFRPMLADGKPQESLPLGLEHTFFYRQADLDRIIEEKRKATNRNSRT